jgi:sugar O-acyltransferase (sialic acid O-acetyltransferase NeuD family)
MPEKLILFPFGGNAREALMTTLLTAVMKKKWQVIGFIDDDPSLWKKDLFGVKVLGGREKLKKFSHARVLAVPGNPDNYLKRKNIIKSLALNKKRFATIIHPSVIISPDAQIGFNTLIMPHVVISCGVKIGNHCVILPNTVISHESQIGDYCCLGSNITISGSVTIKPQCYLGSGTNVRDKITIGEKTLVGLGSNVISNIEKQVIVAGNPARLIRKST